MEKTIKYLENGEYHYATVRSVGDLAQLKTDSKETLVEAINELWNGGGNADPSKAPKPEGYDQLVEDVADAVKNQQEISQQWIEWQKEDAQLTEERKQAYLQAMKEMQESIDKAKADAAALDDKTAKLDEQITKTFSDLDTSIQNMHEQLQKEADRMNQDLINTKSDLTKVRTDLQNAQLDNGKIHDELTNINGKFEHKVWQTDLDPLKAQIDRAETSVQQTKDELLGKASREDLDTVTNAVSKLDTQLKETAKGVEISVKKDELGGEIAEALTNKTNILLGTRRFTTNNWNQRDHVEICSDPWKGFLVAKQNSPIEGIQQAYDVKAGTTYTFSLFAKMDTLDNSNKPQITLAQNNLDTSLDTKIDVWRKEIDDITSDFKRYDLTFTPSEDCTIYPHVISNSNNPIFVCGYQLEIGKELTPWEPNQEDVGDYVEKSEAQFNIYNDKIQALTEKQRQQGDTQEQLRTEVTQTAEGVKQVSESLKNTNGDITKLRGDLERTADHMKSEYESYTNKAVGQISDSTLNLIRNSSFQNKAEDFAQWQNVSAKANVRQDENGLRWVELTQSGLTTDNPQGLTSNYFNVKQGKVTVAVDIKSGTKADLDIESVLTLELYDENKKRVDFTRLTLNDLGLNKSLLGDHQVHRGLYRLGIDRNDAQYMTVKAHLMRNGDLYFTNFSSRLSSIDDGAYEPNPDDINQQILKQNTKIEQNAKEVAIKANSADVTREIQNNNSEIRNEIKSAKEAAIQVASDQVNIRVNELTTSFDDKLNKRVNEVKTASEKFTSDGIEQTVTKITNVKNDVDRLGDKVNGIQVGGRNLVTGTNQDIVIDDTSNTGTQGWCFVTIPLTQQPKVGDQITVSAEGTLTGKGDLSSYSAVLSNSTTFNGRSALANLIPGKRSRVTLTINNLEGTGDTVLLLYAGKQSDTQGKKNIIHHLKVEFGNQATDWSPAPEDINKKIDTQTLDSANINNLKTQGHYFVKALTGNPIGSGWVYVDVTGNNNDRVRQEVYQDNGSKHMYRRLFDNDWSGWEQGAYLSDVNNVKTEVAASVKNLGDRVTTQVNSIETRVTNVNDKVDNLRIGGRNLLLDTDLMSSQYWTAESMKAGYRNRRVLGTNNACLHTQGSPWASFNYKPKVIFDTSKEYTFSAYVCSLKKNQSITLWLNPDNTYRNSFQNASITNTSDDVDWRRLSVTFRPTRTEAYLSIGTSNVTTGQDVWVSSLMLEEGNKASDYKIAPEDTIEAIREVNTKWDVANGQIQGKVTATDVNNILNGKGYATQSWAQTMFQMKSDSITLQAVRDNITNGIQNQVNDAKNQISGLQNASRGDLSNICRNPNFMDGSTAGWQGVTASTGNGSSPAKYYGCIQQRDAYYGDWFTVAAGDQYFFSIFAWQDTSPNHFNFGFVYEQTDGHWNWNTSLTFTPTDHLKTKRGSITIPNNVVKARIWVQIDAQSNFGHWYFTNVVAKRNDAISAINITPDQIKIASNKIVIDGNTDIHGVLRVPDVKLAGRNGNVDLSGDGINITKTNGAGINIASNGIQLTANTNGQNEIEGVITTAWSMNNKNQNGIGLVITPEQTLGRPYGGDVLTIGEMVAPGTIHAGMVFDATGINPDYKRGFNWFAPHTLNGDGGVLRFPGAQDDLMLYPGNMPESRQSEYSQPTLRLVHGNSQGSAGVQFQWYDIVPFGRITSSMSYVSAVGTDDDGGITVSWYSYGAWYNGRKAPSIVYRGSDGNRGNGGIVFYPYGEVCFWQGDFHSNLRWSGMKNTD